MALPKDEQTERGGSLQPRRSMSSPDVLSLLAGDDLMVTPRQGNGYSPGVSAAGSSGSAPRHNVSSAQPSRAPHGEQDLIDLGEALRNAVHVKDRSHHLKTYRQCFVGKDAVRWLLDHGGAKDEADAVLLGQTLLHSGLLHHVTFKHPFENSGRFYRFTGPRDNGPGTSPEMFCAQDVDTLDRLERLFAAGWSRRLPGAATPPGEAASTASSSAPEDGPPAPGLVGSPGAAPHARSRPRSAGGLRLPNTRQRWSPQSELTLLQRRVQDLAADAEVQRAASAAEVAAVREALQGLAATQQGLISRMEELQQGAARQACRGGQVLVAGMLLSLGELWLLAAGGQSVSRGLLLVAVALGLAALAALQWRREETRNGPPRAGSHAAQDAAGVERRHLDMATASQKHWGDVLAPRERTRRFEPEQQGGAQQLGPPAPAALEGWPDAPLLLRPNPGLDHCLAQGVADAGRLRFNDPRGVKFETELFKGRAIFWVRGLAGAPDHLFAGKHRKTCLSVQGRFKRDLALDDVLTGQSFDRPARNVPPQWLVESVLVKMARRISPSMVIGPMSRPYLLVPTIAMAQAIQVSRVGEEPDLAAVPAEDMRLFDPGLADKDGLPLPAARRRALFYRPANRAGRGYGTDLVWTFHLWQHFVDMAALELDMLRRWDLARHLDGQPLRFMMEDRKTSVRIFDFEVWHTKLLPAAQAAQDEPPGKEDAPLSAPSC